MGQRSGRVEPIHQYLEGHVLVLVGGQGAPAHLGQQLGDTGITGHLDPQHQGVDEKPHQLIERRVAPPGDREPHRHLGLALSLASSTARAACTTMKLVALCARAPRATCCCSSAGHSTATRRRGNRPPADRADRWAAPAARASRPGLLPVGQLRGDRAVAVLQITKLRTLPQRVIDILHRQRRPAGACPAHRLA